MGYKQYVYWGIIGLELSFQTDSDATCFLLCVKKPLYCPLPVSYKPLMDPSLHSVYSFLFPDLNNHL